MRKHYLLTLAAGFISLAATAQTPSENLLQTTAQTSGKIHTPLPVKALIKPQMPVTVSAPQKPIIGQMPQLRAAGQALQLDSVIYFTPKGDKSYRNIYHYNKLGQIVEEAYYTASPSGWELQTIALFEGYDKHGKHSKYSSFSCKGQEKVLSSTREYTWYEDGELKSEIHSIYTDGKQSRMNITEYTPSGKLSKFISIEVSNGGSVVTSRSLYEYDAKDRMILSEYQMPDAETGELHPEYRYLYAYDSKGRQVLSEHYRWQDGALALIESKSYAYNENDDLLMSEETELGDGGYTYRMDKYAYDSKDYITSYETLRDEPRYHSHSIRETTYTDDHSAGTSVYRDTTVWKDDDAPFINLYAEDLTYNKQGSVLTGKRYALDPDTEERMALTAKYEYTYNSENRMLSSLNIHYINGQVSSASTEEWEWDKDSYVYSRFTQDFSSEEWILESKYKHEYVKADDNNYYYRNFDWDKETNAWMLASSFKQDYEKRDGGYTQIQYEWDDAKKDWGITYGYTSVDKLDGEDETVYSAVYNIEKGAWESGYSYKNEVVDAGNPKIINSYGNLAADLKTWELQQVSYSYYSASPSANAVVDESVAATVYTRPGCIHIDGLQQPSPLSVHGINGRLFHQSTASGSAVVSGLPSGVYVVTFGTQQMKVRVP